ncbi:O-methyltransferase [Polaribacter sp. IC073]|uniref:O-methyltransferase n=1 Tax=Polaribacter sp. IC073 TaxID=2508540 RepID=UPI0011BE6493|nr:class I SAM-dependent methyltransferase [Polaribacter sp. IC073]TXD47156.1 class I SAM-dependent methyltransferase [Polaribacter sp. IC073]
MLYQQRKYLQFLLKASNQHGVHSPFVYQLITKCFYKKTPKNLAKYFLNIKQHLLNNKKTIEVTDFGAGSKVFKNNTRKIAQIVKVAGIANKKAKLLIKIVTYFKPKNILEIGTSIGLSTTAIQMANSNASIITLEGCPETSKVAKKLFEKNNFNAIEVITGDFSKTLPKVTEKATFDFIYFDGNHTKQATLKYFKECLKTIHNTSFFIFDDIYWNAEMQEAWAIIKNHPEVTVTVDLFYFGIVFFRKEQAKEHFKIRV